MLRSQTPKKKNADVGINARPHRVAFTEGHLPSQIYSWSSPQLPVGGDLLDRVQTLQQRVGQLTRTGVISYVYAHLIPRSALLMIIRPFSSQRIPHPAATTQQNVHRYEYCNCTNCPIFSISIPACHGSLGSGARTKEKFTHYSPS